MWAKYKNRKLANLGVASESLRGSWALVTLVCLALSKVLFWNKQGTCERHAREDVAPNWVCFFGLNISEAAGGAGKNPGPSDVSCTDGKSYSWIVSNGFRCAYAKLCRCKKQQHKQPTNRDGSRGTRLEFVFILRLCTPSHIFPLLHKSSHTDIFKAYAWQPGAGQELGRCCSCACFCPWCFFFFCFFFFFFWFWLLAFCSCRACSCFCCVCFFCFFLFRFLVVFSWFAFVCVRRLRRRLLRLPLLLLLFHLILSLSWAHLGPVLGPC